MPQITLGSGSPQGYTIRPLETTSRYTDCKGIEEIGARIMMLHRAEGRTNSLRIRNAPTHMVNHWSEAVALGSRLREATEHGYLLPEKI